MTKLTYKLDFPGKLCMAAFAILAMFSISTFYFGTPCMILSPHASRSGLWTTRKSKNVTHGADNPEAGQDGIPEGL